MQEKALIFSSKKELLYTYVHKDDVVLDVGFWGQAVKKENPEWIHGILCTRAREVYGVDLLYDRSSLEHPERYQQASAEQFHFDRTFNVIVASEIIEHLSNPGCFLDRCGEQLERGGLLLITTPNAFNLFSIIEKIVKQEPSVNTDHTLYFNSVVLSRLLEKNGWSVETWGYLDSFRGIGWKRTPVYLLGKVLKFFTPKFLETLVVIARKRHE